MTVQIRGSVGSYQSGAVNNTPDIVTVQQLLATAAARSGKSQFDPGPPDGKIARVAARSSTVSAITAFQRERAGMRNPDRRIDVNGNTWRHLVNASGGTVPPTTPTTPARPAPAPVPTPTTPRAPGSGSGFVNALVAAARGEVGIREGSRNNTGADIQKYMEATWLEPGEWPWCAAFVCWCCKEALASNPVPGVRRPRTAGAWKFEDWAADQPGATLIKPARQIQRGDIVMFTFSHIGIAVADPSGGTVQTVEGNTNTRGERDGGGRTRDGVYLKTRPLTSIRSVARVG